MSTWFPIGPDFVYARRDSATPMRLSRGNEFARQAKVKALAVDPSSTPPTLYTVERPYPQGTDQFPHYYPQNPYWPIGGSAFVSQDDGFTWTSIADTLIQASPGLVPACIAVHPVHPATIYLGTDSGEIYVSGDRGSHWSAPQSLGAGNSILQIVVDPRSATSTATTTLYAATNSGLQISTDGGASWSATPLTGTVMSLAFNMPMSGTADLYAGVKDDGVYHATSVTGTWTLLSGSGSGLPDSGAGGYDGVLVDFCRLNPNRVYVVLGGFSPIMLYTSGTGPTGFSAVASPSAPPRDLYRLAFAVAPNSPGDGATDILFISGVSLYRSKTAGASWDICADDLHADHNCFGFSTMSPAPGVIPTTYIGCDGGLYASKSFADKTVNVTVYPGAFGDGLNAAPAGVSKNYNHQKLSVAVRAYSADPASGAYGYTGAQDTGVAGSLGTLSWRGLDNYSDVWGIAVHSGSTGLTVWYTTPFDMRVMTDQGQANPPISEVFSGPAQLSGSSAMRVNAAGQCLTGANMITKLQNAITSTGIQAVTPQSMLGIVPGALVIINNSVIASVTSVTATTFMSDIEQTIPALAPIKVFSGLLFAVDQNGTAMPVSQAFGPDSVKTVAAHPTDPTTAAFVTGTQALPSIQRVWMTTGVALGPSTVWTEAAGATKPSGGLISAVAIDSSGHIYVLLTDLTWTAPGGGAVTSPLYEVSTGSWIPQPASGLPSGQFGSLVVHPHRANTLYATSAGQVYELNLAGGVWIWTQVGTGLPGQAIVDLWIGDVGSASAPKVLLRAAAVARGVWEADVTNGAGTTAPPARPYMRHQALDQGWLSPSLEGQVDPFAPGSGPSLYHWESPDIKVDAQQPGTPPFYQTDPEYPLPIPHGAFDQIIDNSQSLPESDSAHVHVQIHNRSYTALSGVSAWAVWTNCSAGVPSLAASPSHGNAYDFWGQFLSSGTISPSLPSDSPWKAVGAPVTVGGLSVSSPQVASFGWTIPTLASGDPGHYCIVSFAHSLANPISETSFNVDSISISNPQVAQRNLHVTTLAPMNLIHLGFGLTDYVEFHNPSAEETLADWVFDFHGLPPALGAAVQISHVETRDPLHHSIVGALSEHEMRRPHASVEHLREWSERFHASPRAEHPRIPPFAPRIYAVHRSSAFEVRGVREPAHGVSRALFALTTTDHGLLSQTFRFRVLRRVHGRIVGGSTWIVRPSLPVKGRRHGPPPFVEPAFPVRGRT